MALSGRLRGRRSTSLCISQSISKGFLIAFNRSGATIDPHGLAALAWAVVGHAGGTPGRSRYLPALLAPICLGQSVALVHSRLSRSRDGERRYEQQPYEEVLDLHNSAPSLTALLATAASPKCVDLN